MLDHPALNWLRQHPRIFALMGSLLIAGYVLSLGEMPNDDAYTYVRVADIMLHDGLAAAYAHYPWATYPVLFAHFVLIDLDLFTAGRVLNALLYALLAVCFVSVAGELVRSAEPTRRSAILFLAAVTVLLYPQLNEYRSMLIRDVGYWAFMLLGLQQLMVAVRVPARSTQFWRRLVLFFTALVVAFFFRAEALAYLLLTPVLFCFVRDQADNRRVGDALRVTLALLALGIAALATCLAAGVDILALLARFIGTYAPFIEATFSPDDTQRAAQSSVLFGEHAEVYSGDYLPVFLLIGLLSILAVSMTSAVGLPYLTVIGLTLAKAWRDRHQRSTGDLASTLGIEKNALIVVAGFALINLGILIGFVLVTRFVSARYGMLFSLLVALLIPLLLYRALEAAHSRRVVVTISFLFAYCLIDSFVSFGERKTFLEESIDWVKNNDTTAPLLTNNHTLAYASERIEAYDKTPRYFSLQRLRETSSNTILVIELNTQMRETLQQLVQNGEAEVVASFPAQSPRIGIYRRL
ncbi:MAG: hypothetical protein ISP89_06715 [Pseudomonadales bacterium]|nr:hypothetical protein [Pseudomonadales bacterium]